MDLITSPLTLITARLTVKTKFKLAQCANDAASNNLRTISIFCDQTIFHDFYLLWPNNVSRFLSSVTKQCFTFVITNRWLTWTNGAPEPTNVGKVEREGGDEFPLQLKEKNNNDSFLGHFFRFGFYLRKSFASYVWLPSLRKKNRQTLESNFHLIIKGNFIIFGIQKIHIFSCWLSAFSLEQAFRPIRTTAGPCHVG